MSANNENSYIVRLRGLPWSVRKDEVMHFLRECQILNGEDGIHFTYSREGRPSGEAFVELETEEDLRNAQAQNNEHIGSRYIEVFRVDRSEMEWMIKRAGAGVSQNQGASDAVVKLRGLPFGCSKEEIAQFFTGLEIVPNGIMLPEDRQGRSTGEAFVQFASPPIAERALEKHKERIGHRYIEIFKSSMSEANAAGGVVRGIRPLMSGLSLRPGPYDRGDRFSMGLGVMGLAFGRGRGRNIIKGGFYDDDFDDFGFGGGIGFGLRSRRLAFANRGLGIGMERRDFHPGSCYISKTGHSVHMRGLPFQALEQDVFDFFSPIQPVRCEFEFGENGRPSGEANVDFATHQEAVEAMKKHKSNMQHRYIELFLNSHQNVRNPIGNASGSYGSSGGGGGGLGGGFGANNNFNDDMDGPRPGFGNGQAGFGGNQGGFRNQDGGFGNGVGFGNGGGMNFNLQDRIDRPLGMNNYDMGGGFGDRMVGGGRMMGNNYTAF